ncbi:substrate-binding domain-containing protein [Rhodococcus erythropolis]
MAAANVVLASVVLTAACGTGASSVATQEVDRTKSISVSIGKLDFDFANYCGDKPVSVGILDGFAGNAWAVGKNAMLKELLAKCDNIEATYFADANGDVQKYISSVNSLSAQGANIIETFDYMGQPTVPAFRAAQQNGLLAGSANAIPGNGKIPTDFSAITILDYDSNAEAWVKFATEATNNQGVVAYIGGPAGNLVDAPQLEAINREITKQNSGIKIATPEPLVGDWDPAKTQQVMAGLLQKNPDVNVVINSYAATGPAVVRAYEAARLPMPVMTGRSSSMELVCLAHNFKDRGLKVQSLDGTPNLHAISLAKLLAKWSDVPAPELGPEDEITTVQLAEYINTEAGVLPACDESVPPGADFSTALPREQLIAAFN